MLSEWTTLNLHMSTVDRGIQICLYFHINGVHLEQKYVCECVNMCVYVSVCVSVSTCLLVSVISLSQTLTHIHICAHMCRVTGWPQKCSAENIYLGWQNQNSKMASKLVTHMYTGPSPQYRGYKFLLLRTAVLTSFFEIN